MSSVPDLELTLAAYAQGLFPMDDPDEQDSALPFYRADPRAIFEVADLPAVRRRVRRSLAAFSGDQAVDRAFATTVAHCAQPRGGGVWLTERMAGLYDQLHAAGFAHSFELWTPDGRLAAGMLGVVVGRAAMLETMFHTVAHAGNANLVLTLERLARAGVTLLDIQIISDHTRRLGAVEISASEFESRLRAALSP